MSWIPFHEDLRKGAKRGLPRAVRFVYLELAQEARAYDGRIPLARGFKSDLDAVHDILGGNRREVALALDTLTQPDVDGRPMIELIGEETRRVLVVVAFDRWVKRDSSTERMRRMRSKGTEQSRESPDQCDVTRDDEVASRDGSRAEQRREEQSKAEESGAAATAAPSQPPVRGEPEIPKTAEPVQTAEAVQPKTREPAKTREGSKTARGCRLPPDWKPTRETIRRFRESEGVDARACVDRFRDYWASATGRNATKLDWEATFRNWVRDDIARGRVPPWPDGEAEVDPPIEYGPPATPEQVREIFGTDPVTGALAMPWLKPIADPLLDEARAADAGANVFWKSKAKGAE